MYVFTGNNTVIINLHYLPNDNTYSHEHVLKSGKFAKTEIVIDLYPDVSLFQKNNLTLCAWHFLLVNGKKYQVNSRNLKKAFQ